MKPFIPSDTLIGLADTFSKYYPMYAPGIYSSLQDSDGHVYTIIYKDFEDEYKKGHPYSICRINSENGDIEIQRTQLSDEVYTADYAFFLVIWCASLYKQNAENEGYSEIDADKEAGEYCFSKGRNVKNILMGFLTTLDTAGLSADDYTKSRVDGFCLLAKRYY